MTMAAGLQGATSLASIFANLYEQGQQQKIANAQLALGMRNSALQEMLANRAYKLSTAGREGPEGRVYFDASGWHEIPSEHGRIVASQEDLIRDLALKDIQRQANENMANAASRREAGGVADTARRKIEAGGGPTEGSLRALLQEKYLAENMDPLNKARSAFNTIDLRGGAANARPILEDINKLGVAGTRSALARSAVDAAAMYPALRDAYGGQARQDYGDFTKVAQGVPGAANFNPGNDASQLASDASQAAALAPQTLGIAGSALRGAGGATDAGYKSAIASVPNYGLAASGLGGALSDFYTRRKVSGDF